MHMTFDAAIPLLGLNLKAMMKNFQKEVSTRLIHCCPSSVNKSLKTLQLHGGERMRCPGLNPAG